jgi:hypothetical protein
MFTDFCPMLAALLVLTPIFLLVSIVIQSGHKIPPSSQLNEGVMPQLFESVNKIGAVVVNGVLTGLTV